MKYGSDKEIQAICMLQKEQRLLEKRDAALKLEQEYSLKLIELSSREVKLSQRRLKTNVGKIKSYLSAEEIKTFRQQELQGKFKPEINTVNVSGAFTIAAAAKRLKLQSDQRMAANGLDSDGKPIQSQGKKRQKEFVERLTRSAPPRRWKGSSTTIATEIPTAPHSQPARSLKRSKTCSTFRDFDSVFDDSATIPDTPKTPWAAASVASMPRDSMSQKLPLTSTGDGNQERNLPRNKCSLGYSSHDVIERESRDRDRSEQATSTNRHLSRRPSFSGSSIDGDIVKGRAEERRQILLDVEEQQSLKLMNKQKQFLDRIKKWVDDHTDFQDKSQVEKLIAVLQKNSKPDLTFAKEEKAPERRKPRRTNALSGKVVFRKRQDPLEVEWKTLNKCRYLRIKEDEVDLSGVVTLATEQMKALRSLRVKDYDEED